MIMRKSRDDRVFDLVNTVLLVLALVIVLYPLYFVVMDGCTNTQLLLRIILPLSKPVLAVMALFYGVAHWNEFFNALIYINSKSLYPLQLVLRSILIQNQMSDNMLGDLESLASRQVLAESIKYALIVGASAPIIAVYPLLQKYFVKGQMIGAIKG